MANGIDRSPSWVWHDPEWAQFYQQSRSQPHDMWEVNGEGLHLRADPNYEPAGSASYTHDTIGPERLRLLNPGTTAKTAGWVEAKETPNQLQRRVEELHQQYPNTAEVVHTFPNGHTVQKLNTYGDVYRTGKTMLNCWQPAPWDEPRPSNEPLPNDDPYTKYSQHYTINDPSGIPHTAFYYGAPQAEQSIRPHVDAGHHYIHSAFGPRNRHLQPEHVQMLEDWAGSLGGPIQWRGVKKEPFPGETLVGDEADAIPARVGEPRAASRDEPNSPADEWHQVSEKEKEQLMGDEQPDHQLKQSELVPIDVLDQMHEFDRRPGLPSAYYTPERWNALKAHIALHGITSPVWIDYNPDTNECHLSEGNHRLGVAKELGMTHLPAVVYKSTRKSKGNSIFAPRKPSAYAPGMNDPSYLDEYDRMPQYMKPSELGFESKPWGKAEPYGGSQWRESSYEPHIYKRGTMPFYRHTEIPMNGHNEYRFNNDEQFHEGYLKNGRDLDRFLDYENPMDYLRSHLMQLANEYGVHKWQVRGQHANRHPSRAEGSADDMSSGWADTKRHALETGPITNRASYLMGLHELAHLVGGREEMHDKFGPPVHAPGQSPIEAPTMNYNTLDYGQEYRPAEHPYDPEWGGYPTADKNDPTWQHAQEWTHAAPDERPTGLEPDVLESLGLGSDGMDVDRVPTSPFTYEENRLETEARAWEWALQHSKIHVTAPVLQQMFSAMMTYAKPQDISYFSPTAKRIFEQHYGFGGETGRYPLDEKEYGPGAEGEVEPWQEFATPAAFTPEQAKQLGQPQFLPTNTWDNFNFHDQLGDKFRKRNDEAAEDEKLYYRLEPSTGNDPDKTHFIDPQNGTPYAFPWTHPFVQWFNSGMQGDPPHDPSAPHMQKAASGADHAGAMIALFPPKELAEQMAVEGGEAADELHITLAYFNDKAADREQESWDDVGETLAKLAREHGPFDIKIGGIARFDAPDKDVEPVVGTVDSPGLAEFHVALKEAMEAFGGLNEEHGWNPHLTFSYSPKGEDNPDVDLPFDWKATEVTLVVGGDKTTYKLSKGSEKAANALAAFLGTLTLPRPLYSRTASFSDSLEAVQSVLTPDLLHNQWRERWEPSNPLAGHCYAASEALYHMLGGKGAGLTPMQVGHEGASHWFLSGPNGEIIDPTHGQFETPVPYEKARGRGFLTAHPSKRAKEIMRRVSEKSAGWTVVADEDFEQKHPRDHGKFTVKHDQHEVKVHDKKGKHEGTIKRCKHCGYLYQKPAEHQGRFECPTCGQDPERVLRQSAGNPYGNDPDAVAQSLGWGVDKINAEGHKVYVWQDEFGNPHTVTGYGDHTKGTPPQRQAMHVRQNMTKCMQGKCTHPKVNIGAQHGEEPGAPVLHAGQEVIYNGVQNWITNIDGDVAHIYDASYNKQKVPVNQLRAASADNCIYCNTPLVKAQHHPTWKLCPNCDKHLIAPVARPQIDMRGAPSRPGPVSAAFWRTADDDLAERVQEFNNGDHPDTDPDYAFVYYQGKLEMQPWHHNMDHSVLADQLLKTLGTDVLNYDGKLENDTTSDWVAGDVWNGREVEFSIPQLAKPDVVDDAKAAVKEVLRGKTSGWHLHSARS